MLPLRKLTATLILTLALAASICVVTPSCTTSAARATYVTAATTTVTVEAALRAYNVFAANGKTTVAQNAQVKKAFERYQASMMVLCDAGAIYAAGMTNTNLAAQAAVQQAALNASASINDIINLIRSFGVKI